MADQSASRDAHTLSRRQFAGALVSAALAAGCGAAGQIPSDARVRARPRKALQTRASGTAALGLDAPRDAVLHVPYPAPTSPVPLLVLLHGAGNAGAGILRRLVSFADEAGVVVLAPDSRGATWDAVRAEFGPDPRFIERALERVFDTVDVDVSRVAIGGFSDGATYALSLGLLNGDLFRRIVAFSPGFVVGTGREGAPSIFVSHGTGDTILPVDRCSRRIVPHLKERGYTVTYREFDGGHDIPSPIAREGMRFVA